MDRFERFHQHKGRRRLGHASQRYIDRYTHPPEDIAAGYVEAL